MDFSKRHADPRRHLVGFTFVVLFHAAIVYALVTGLAKKVVDVVRAPIETKVIEEVKKPPPPPEVVVPPPPKLEAPPPPFIPPPEVQIATPPPPAPTITVVTPTPPPAPVVIAPAPPPPPAPVVVEAPPPPPPPPPPAPPAPKPVTIGVLCPKQVKPEVPGVDFTGTISLLAKITIKGGKVAGVEVPSETIKGTRDRKIQRAFANAVTASIMQYSCTTDTGGAGDSIIATQEFSFTIN